MNPASNQTPSLENLVETEDLGLDVLHPGGLALTSELLRMCGAGPGATVLDIACGAGTSACHIATEFGTRVVGLDGTERMLRRAQRTAAGRELPVQWVCGDAHALPFPDSSFDVVICECTLCALDKLTAAREMLRVVEEGGTVGIHDLCWRPDTPESLRRRLIDLEQEEAETAEGWRGLMQEAGFHEVEVFDRSEVLAASARETAARLGIRGYLGAVLKVLRRWGFGGLRRVLASERLFRDPHLGYVVMLARKGSSESSK